MLYIESDVLPDHKTLKLGQDTLDDKRRVLHVDEGALAF